MARVPKIPRPGRWHISDPTYKPWKRRQRTYLKPNADRRERAFAKWQAKRLRRRAERRDPENVPRAFWLGWVD